MTGAVERIAGDIPVTSASDSPFSRLYRSLLLLIELLIANRSRRSAAFRVTVRNNSTRLRRIWVRLQGTSSGAYRDTCRVSVHRAPHLPCCRALEVQKYVCAPERLASAAPCKRLQLGGLKCIGFCNPANGYRVGRCNAVDDPKDQQDVALFLAGARKVKN